MTHSPSEPPPLSKGEGEPVPAGSSPTPGVGPLLPRWLWPTLAAAVLLSLAAAGDGVLPGDVAFARAAQGAVLPELRGVVEAVNRLGRVVPGALAITLAVAGFLFWAGQRAAALLVGATLPLRAVNPALKALIDSPRPSDTLVAVSERADGLGFPSGHATGAMLLFGAVIVVAPLLTASPSLQRAVRVLATLAILAAGTSRVAVGAHWASDVLGGYLWGGVVLGLLVTVVRLPRHIPDRTDGAPASAQRAGRRVRDARAEA